MPCRWITLWVILLPSVALADQPATDIDARFAIMQGQLDALNKRLEQLEQAPLPHLPPPAAATDTTNTVTTVTDKTATDKAVTGKTVTDKTVTDKAVTGKTVTDKTVTDKTVTDAIDSHPPTVPAPARPELAAYQELEELRTNWKQLQRGISRTELRRLLGKPGSELTLDQQTLWYYRYPAIGGGSVMLDSQGKVTGWQKPPFHGW